MAGSVSGKPLFHSLVKVLLGQDVGPVLERLPDHRTDFRIVEASVRSLEDLPDEKSPPASIASGAADPPPDLALVVVGSTPLKKNGDMLKKIYRV